MGNCIRSRWFYFECCAFFDQDETLRKEEKLIVAFIDSSCSMDNDGQLNHYDYVLQAFSRVLSNSGRKVNYEILHVNVLGSEGEGSVRDLVKAIEYAQKKGAKICNLSLSTYVDYKELKEIIADSNMLFVAAAGNEGENLDEGFPSYPANYKLKNVISVAAVDENEMLLESSNYGSGTVDIAMNGIIECNGEFVEGTSIATGKVTAAAVMLYSMSDVELSVEECKGKVMALTTKNRSLAGKVRAEGSIREKYLQKIMKLL